MPMKYQTQDVSRGDPLICKMQDRGLFALVSQGRNMIQSALEKLSPNLQSAD